MNDHGCTYCDGDGTIVTDPDQGQPEPCPVCAPGLITAPRPWCICDENERVCDCGTAPEPPDPTDWHEEYV